MLVANWCAPAELNVYRHRCGRGFVYRDAQGKPVREAEVLGVGAQIAVRLIDLAHLRPGSEPSLKEIGSRGATTLRRTDLSSRPEAACATQVPPRQLNDQLLRDGAPGAAPPVVPPAAGVDPPGLTPVAPVAVEPDEGVPGELAPAGAWLSL